MNTKVLRAEIRELELARFWILRPLIFFKIQRLLNSYLSLGLEYLDSRIVALLQLQPGYMNTGVPGTGVQEFAGFWDPIS